MKTADDGGDDPYAPPEEMAGEPAGRPAALRENVVAWEKLRVIYNLVLLLPGLPVAEL